MSHCIVTVLGSANAFNSAGRGNSCYWVHDHLGHYVVDFGPTAPLKCQTLNMPLDQLDTVYITHLHGDHIGGLASLILDLNYIQNRTHPLKIAGPKGTRARLELLYRVMYPGVLPESLNFQIDYYEWKRTDEQEVSGRKVISIPAVHDLLAYPCSISINNEYQRLVFSGDTGWNEDLITLSDQADLFFCECSYEVYRFDGHLSLEEILAQRHRLQCNKLILTHFGHEARQAALKKAIKYNFTVAEDGLQIIL
jgi:ribonuclease BN (tRNA processing enzyme)